jgi:hypothetical protein
MRDTQIFILNILNTINVSNPSLVLIIVKVAFTRRYGVIFLFNFYLISKKIMRPVDNFCLVLYITVCLYCYCMGTNCYLK